MTPFDFSDDELITLSAALQVYHNTAPEFGRSAFLEHEDMFGEKEITELERGMVALANRFNDHMRGRISEENMTEMQRRIATLGTHAVRGSAEFRDMTIRLLETIASQMN